MTGILIPRGIGSILIILLPKNQSPSTFANFRPISLCTFLSKFFLKILCNRLKKVLPHLISIEQFSFVEGRHISNNIMTLQRP